MENDRAVLVSLRAIVEQRTVEKIADVPMPRIQEQIVDASVPYVMNEIREEIMDIRQERFFECTGKAAGGCFRVVRHEGALVGGLITEGRRRSVRES